MPIAGHKLIYGIGVGCTTHSWGKATDTAALQGVARFNDLISELEGYTQYIKFISYVAIMWEEYEPNAPTMISNVSNGTPIEITTSTPHGKSTGNVVSITGVGGDNAAAANGFHRAITVTSSTKFTINGSVGDGNWVSTGEVRTYNFDRIEEAVSLINSVTGKGGVGLKTIMMFRSLSFRPEHHACPAWARTGGYDYEVADGKDTRIKIWHPDALRAWTSCQEAVVSKYKDDSRVVAWTQTETAVGMSRAVVEATGYTDELYHQGLMAELEAMRRGDPQGVICATYNYYPGGWGGAKTNEYLAKCVELTIHMGPHDPVCYGKSVSDYYAAKNLHKGIFKWMRDNQATHPMGGFQDIGCFNQWFPPWTEALNNDPYPEAAARHLSFSSQYVKITPDDTFYYPLHYQKSHFRSQRWPTYINHTDYTLPELKDLFRAALARYTDSFPNEPDAYAGGAAPGLVTDLAINMGGPEYDNAGETFIADAGPTSSSGWTFLSKSSTVSGSTIGQTPYQKLVQLTDTSGYMEYAISGLENGTWTAEIFYIETYHATVGQRLFHLDIQGSRVQTDYDIYAEAGAQNTEVIDTHTGIIVTNNQLVLRWTADAAATDPKAEVFALRLSRTSAATEAPPVFYRSNTGSDSSYVTSDGRTFEADIESRWTNGSKATRPAGTTVTGTTIDDEPYLTLRRAPSTGYMEAVYSNLANGSDWTAKIYYIEYWWTSAGLRSFHLDIQGNRVQTDYDIYAEAGGQLIEVIDTHTGIVVADNTMTLRWTAGTASDPKAEPYAVELIKGSNPPAETGDAFTVQRGTMTFSGATQTDTSFSPVSDVSKTLETIPGSQHTAGGAAAGTAGEQINLAMAYLELTNTTTLTGTAGSASSTAYQFWELAEYTGTGNHGWTVRHRSVITFADTETVKDVAISGVSDITQVVPFITVGSTQATTASLRALFAAEVLTGTDEIRLTRRASIGEAKVALVVLEMGTNWTVQQNITHTFTATGTDETETIADVLDWTQCCIVPSFTSGSSIAEETGVTMRPGANTTTVRFRVDGGAIDQQYAVAHVLKNSSITVEHLDSITGGESALPAGNGSTPRTANYTVNTVSLAETMLIVQATDGNAFGSNAPAPQWMGRLTTSTNVEMWNSSTDGNAGDVVLQVIQLPQESATDTTAPTIPQNLSVVGLTSTSLRATADPSTDAESGISHYEWELDDVVQAGTTETPQKDFTGLTEYTEYAARVRAYDNAGNMSGWSSPDSGKTADETAPANGSINSVSQVGNTVTFDLTLATDAGSGVEGYNLFNDGDLYGLLEEDFTAEIQGTGTYTWAIQAYDFAGNLGAVSAEVVFETLPIYPSYAQGYDGSREDLENVIFDRANGKLRGRILHSEESFDLTIVHPYLTNTERQELNAFWESAMGVQVTVTLQDTGESHLCYMRARPEFIPLTYDGSEHSFKAIVKFIK